MIPKKIHHIWLQGEGEIPGSYRENLSKWKEMNPDWDQIFWDERALTQNLFKNYPQFKDIYNNNESFINKVNILKYLILHQEGGVYADLDSYPIKSIEEFLNCDRILDINREAKIHFRFPYNVPYPSGKKFGSFNVILPGKNSLCFLSGGQSLILLDNPILISERENRFWINLLIFCKGRTELRDHVIHEPYGPFGMSEFLFRSHGEKYIERGIVVIPDFMMMNESKIYNDTYIVHQARAGWRSK